MRKLRQTGRVDSGLLKFSWLVSENNNKKKEGRKKKRETETDLHLTLLSRVSLGALFALLMETLVLSRALQAAADPQ